MGVWADAAAEAAYTARPGKPTGHMTMTETETDPGSEREAPPVSPRKLRLGALVASVLAGALGVQSSENRERDFNQGNAGVFIVGGLVFTVLFIATVVFVVQMVLASR